MNKGYNITKLDFLPSEFYYYDFNKIRVQDLSISQVTNLSIINGAPDLAKLIEIYAPSFVDLTPYQVGELLYIDFIAAVHYINHLTFGVYNNSFSCECPECGEKSKVEYNLYSLDFKANKTKNKDIVYNNLNIKLKPFTANSMAKLIELGLEDNKDAFVSICIDSVTSENQELEWFSTFTSTLESLPKYPYSLKATLIDEIAKRYPTVLPVNTFLSCGHKLTFTPDLTLKGLPSFTSI